jgi:hypothetical protein
MHLITRTAIAGAIAGAALLGTNVTASADPGCDYLGFLHPLCAGGAWEDEKTPNWGPDASTRAGLDAVQEPAMVPNISGGLSEPGTPGAI